jgi:hypothetical protein
MGEKVCLLKRNSMHSSAVHRKGKKNSLLIVPHDLLNTKQSKFSSGCGGKSMSFVIIHITYLLHIVDGSHPGFTECTASSRPFLSKEASAAYATHRRRE